MIRLIQNNYPGYQDKRRRFGSARIDDATQRAREQSEKAASEADLDAVIDEYLKIFQDGHLFIIHTPKPAATPPAHLADKPVGKSKASGSSPAFLPPTQAPSARVISESTFYIKVPSFMPEHRPTLEALLSDHHTEMVRRPFLILDVRDNHGGADTTFAALLPLIYEKPIASVGMDGFATRDVIAAWKRVLPTIPAGETQMRKWFEDNLQKLRSARKNTFVSVDPDRVIRLQRMPMPRHVVILINKGCVSSTEQFLLEAHPSKKVVLIGQTTYGALDYGDIRPFPLPSSERTLWIPTTRSRRLPKHPIDGIGIAPDVPFALSSPGTDVTKSNDPELDFALNYLARLDQNRLP